MFQTKYNRIDTPLEVNSGEIITEQNYVSAELQINRMLQAGQRLSVARGFDFEDPSKVDETFEDPTRQSDFDLADATMLYSDVVDKFNQQIDSEKLDNQEPAKVEDVENKPILE